MKRLLPTRSACVTFLVLAAGCCAALMATLWAGAPASADQPDSPANVGVAAPPRSGVASLSPFSCTLSYTTTADSTGQGPTSYFPDAVPLESLPELSLVGSGNINQTIQAFDEYFRLDNAEIGASYKVDAIPNYTDNYNLGLIVYRQNGSNYTPILSDTNPLDNRSASVTLQPDTIGPYFFKVSQIASLCRGRTYRLNVSYTAPPATPTITPTATAQPWTQPDSDEPNENINSASVLLNFTGRTLYNTSYPDYRDDNDWYATYGGAGYQYSVSASPESGYTYPYLFLEIYAPDKTTLIGRVESSNNPTINWTASTSGNYYIHIKRADGSPTNGTYKITLTTNAPPTPTSTATPGPGTPTNTPVPGADVFEPNFNFDTAAGIGLNVKYTNLNFVPTLGGTVDNDFFKLRVKRGMLVTCETLDLSPGTDTNMILYDNDRNGLAGNDDVDLLRGELRSRVTVSINYDGYLYVLVGQGYAVPDAQASQYTYSLQCTSGQTGATSTPAPPTRTPQPPGAASSATPVAPAEPPSATPPPTTAPVISVRPLATSTPAGPPQQIVIADLRVSYDANGNGNADPGEGVVGLLVRVYDDTTGALLAQGFTDDTGRALLSVPSSGPIKVLVPYLSFETLVPPSGAAIPVLISPRGLPDQIP